MSFEAKPFIGITGATTFEESRTMTEILRDVSVSLPTHDGALGFLVRLQRNILRVGSMPDLSQLPSLLQRATGVRNAIHLNTTDPSTISYQVYDIFEGQRLYEKGLSDLLQLNMEWPDINQVSRIKEKFPELDIILQLNRSIIDAMKLNDIHYGIQEYGDLVSHVLIDTSGGQGKEFEPPKVAQLMRMIAHHHPNKTLIIAGGLSSNNIHEQLSRVSLLTGTKTFGIDAQRNLMTRRNGRLLLSAPRAREYVNASVDFFKSK